MYEKCDAVRTGRAAARPARVALTHATGVLLVIVAVFSLFSAKAYALPGSEKNAYPLGDILMSENVGSNRGTAVYGAANEFFATLCLIGRKSDYLQLSSDQLAELSNEGTGGAFWDLSQRWSNYGSDGEPSDWPAGITLAIIGQGLVSDPAYIWYADYSYYESDSLYQRALADYLTIYNGGHLGSGGIEQYEGWYKFDLPAALVPYSSSGTTITVYGTPTMSIGDDGKGSIRNTGGSVGTFSFADGDLTLLVDPYSYQYIKDNGYSNVCWIRSFSGTYAISFDGPFEWVRGTTDSNYRIKNSSSTALHYRGFTNTTNGLYMIDGKVCCFITSAGTNYSRTVNANTTDGYNYKPFWNTVHGPDYVGPSDPLPPWPEPDPNPDPDPPEVPEPEEPTGPGIDPPNPIGYTIDPTDDPDPVTDPYVVVVAPDSQDIIPWLRAILQAINNVGDKLNDESTELQRALNDVFFGNLSKLLKNLKGEFLQDFTQWLGLEHEWMMESIESLILDLQDYLHDLFEWLADQMNFEFDISTDPYDDTSLLNWLRRIYNKLGSDGGPNTRPVDPSTDPEGFLDWLRRMIAEFILGLGASASDFVSDLGDLLSRLFAKFPFSVPWDLLGILGLLDAAPVAPRANFTIPLTIGNQEFNWTVDINLTGWSTYMESVRTIILVSFISWLAWLTPNVLRDLDPGDFL